MNKKLKSIEVGLIGCGDAVTLNASDTATEPIATYALDKFKAEDQMSFKDNGTEYYVPFHAVDHIEVTETTESVADRPNPYGCEGDTPTPSGDVWFVGTIDESRECDTLRIVYPITVTEIADVDALSTNPTDYNLTMNGVILSYHFQDGNSHYWAKSESEEIPGLLYEGGEVAFQVPCDWTGEVSVTVTHK